MTINNIAFANFGGNEFIQNRVFSIPIGQVFGKASKNRQEGQEGIGKQAKIEHTEEIVTSL